MTYFPNSATSIAASALPAAGTLSGSEILVVTQGGGDVQTTLTAVGALIGAATPAVPGAPGVPVKGSTTTTTIVLTWTAPTSGGTPTSYMLQQSATGAGSWATIATTSALSATASGLAAGTGYDFRVAAANAGGTGAYSTVLSNAQTSASLAAPNAVTGLAASAITSSGLTLGWAESGGAPSTRTVTQRTPSGSGSYVAAAGSFGSTGGAVTGLAASASYDFQVVETNATGSSPAATLTGVTTAAATPAAVTSLAAGAITATTVALTWTNAATATGWNVLQRTPSGSGTFVASTLSVAATATGATVSGLTTGNVYDFEVVTANSYGTSSQVAVLTGITPAAGASPPGQVTAVTLGTPTPSAMPITWTAPASGGTPTGFRVELSTDGGTTFGTPLVVSGWDTYYAATGLTAGTSYVARVTATNAGGSGTVSANSAAVSTLASGAVGILITAPATVALGSTLAPTFAPANNGGSYSWTTTLNGVEQVPSNQRAYLNFTSNGTFPAISLAAPGTATVRIFNGSGVLLAESRPITVTGTATNTTLSATFNGTAYNVVVSPSIPASVVRASDTFFNVAFKNAASGVADTGGGYFSWATNNTGTSPTQGGYSYPSASDGNFKFLFDGNGNASNTRYLWIQSGSTGFAWVCVTPSNGIVVP